MQRLILAITFAAVCIAAAAQDAPKIPKYNPATEMTLRGDVAQIRDYSCPVSGGIGRHLTLRMRDGTQIEVHLGPTSFVQFHALDLTLSPTEVTGSAVEVDGIPVLIARTLTQKRVTYVFRDAKGNPAW